MESRSIQDASVTFGSAKDRWAINTDLMKERGITFKDVIDAYTDEKVADLVEKAPLADAVLGMVVKTSSCHHTRQSNTEFHKSGKVIWNPMLAKPSLQVLMMVQQL